MNFKTVKLLLLLSLFAFVVLATPMSSVNTFENKALRANLNDETTTTINYPTTILIGDPVGGGTPRNNQTGV
jgi:hypothetical protein